MAEMNILRVQQGRNAIEQHLLPELEPEDSYYTLLAKILNKRATEMESAKQKGEKMYTTKEVIQWVRERREGDATDNLE